MTRIHVQFSLFSAFYAPLIETLSGDWLAAEGLEADWSVSPPGVSAIEALKTGEAQVIQSAPSQAFGPLQQGEAPPALHFAQINEMDGFFLTAREPDPAFTWDKLEGAEVVLFGGGQPRAMFDYACKKAGVDPAKITAITPGGPDAMDAAFRAGQGAYAQAQGPYPQALAAEGLGHVVAQVGPLIGPCAFSSLAAAPEWLETEEAAAFTRAYRAARAALLARPAAETAARMATHFPGVSPGALTACLDAYKALGCWTPHIEITRDAFDVTQDVFEAFGTLKARVPFEGAVAAPPA